MKQATISVRTEMTTKEQFDAFCTEVGMNTTVAINLFMRAVLREKKLPFEVRSDMLSPSAQQVATASDNWLEILLEMLPADPPQLPDDFDYKTWMIAERLKDYENLD